MSAPVPAPPPDASATRRGLVNLLAQSFTGAKRFIDRVLLTVGVDVGTPTLLPNAHVRVGAATPQMYLESTGDTGVTATGAIFFGNPLYAFSWILAGSAPGNSNDIKEFRLADGNSVHWSVRAASGTSHDSRQYWGSNGVTAAADAHYTFKHNLNTSSATSMASNIATLAVKGADGTANNAGAILDLQNAAGTSMASVSLAGVGRFAGGVKFADNTTQTTAATSPDLSSYETSAHAASTYLALGGGTLTGGLTGTTFTGTTATFDTYRAAGTNSVNFKSYVADSPGSFTNPRYVFDTNEVVSTYQQHTVWKAAGTEVASLNFAGGLNIAGFNGGVVTALGQWGQVQLRQGGAPTAGKAAFMNPYGSTRLAGTPADGAGAVANRIASDTNLTVAGARIAEFANVDTVVQYVGKNGQFGFITGTAADVCGTATLVGGSATVATTAVRSTSKIFLTRNTSGGTLGDLKAPVGSIVAATSFVITSASGTDTSTVNWFLVDIN